MTDAKTCPLLSIGESAPVPCLEDHCAWWTDRYFAQKPAGGECALAVAASSLDGINIGGISCFVND